MTDWIDVGGWTLLHFVWQGAAIALAAALTFRLLLRARPQVRYAVGCSALAVMLAAPICTAFVLSSAPARATLAGRSIHLLHSPQGAVLGIAFVPAVSPARGTAPPTAPIELRLPSPVNTQSLMSTLVALWLAGVALLLARFSVAGWRLRRLARLARREPVSRWQGAAETIARQLSLRVRFVVIDAIGVSAPAVVGWLRPVVLLPVASLTGLSPRQVEAILAHELAHIRRHDFVVNLLQTLAETVLFYHPAVWWVSRRIRAEREHCCDDVAVAVCGDAHAYAEALTELASRSLAHAPLALAAARGPLIARVRRLLHLAEPSDQSRGRSLFVVATALTAIVGLGTLGAILKAQPLIDGGPRIGPGAVNEALGYNLFPGPVHLPTDDPRGTKAWGVTLTDGAKRHAFIGFTARGLIREAFDLGRIPITGAPEWMDRESFEVDIPAVLASDNGSPAADEVHTALRRFLGDTLALTMHRERREFPAYALVRARSDGALGPDIRPSAADCAAGPLPAGAAPPAPGLVQAHVTRRFCGIDNHLFGLRGERVTMSDLALEFHRTRYPLAPGREIVDRTGLSGEFDFDLRFGLLPLAAIGYANPALGAVLHPFGLRNVFTALPEQLGLTLVDTTVTREVMVIDRIDRPAARELRN